MKFFLDTGNLEEIQRILKLGLVDGITTNPSLIAKEEGRKFRDVIQEITDIVPGPVSAEVVSLDVEGMVKEGRELAQWAPNIVVKIPMTEAGLEATHILSQEGVKINVTLIFTAAQGLMAAKAGATYISPFIGRLDDIGIDGMELIRALREIIDIYDLSAEIIAASIRSLVHIEQAARAGAHIATIPGSLFPKLWAHPLTDIGIERFLKDWEKVPKP